MKTFEELGIVPAILHAIADIGFEHPMPIQEEVIPYLLEKNNDVIALAQTGTGKTAAYGLPLIQKTDPSLPTTQAIVIAPTRELCLQITDDLKSFSKYIPSLRILAVYGGADIMPQIRSLRQGVHIIVATPGRLVDLMKRGVADISNIKSIVLDEADEMLNMGFSESIDAIFSQCPPPDLRNTLLFSATMSKEIERIARNYLHDHDEIVVGSRNEGAEHVNHYYYLVAARDKYNALKRIADYYPEIYAIIFCRTRLETQEIADRLIQDGYNAESLHGELSQMQRDLTMQKFRQHRTQLLVATDVAARGLDVDELTHVINYGLPDDIESYTHRSGRTGRAGRSGTSISIIHIKEKHKIQAIERQIQKKFIPSLLPSGQEICAKQLYKLIDDIEKIEVDDEEIEQYMPEIYRKLDLLDKEDLIKRMVSMQFNTFLNYYKNAPEIIQPSGKGDSKGDSKKQQKQSRKRTAEQGYTRLFINLGKKDHLSPKVLLGFINRKVRGKTIDLGRIDLMHNFSFFEVPEDQTDDVLHYLSGTEFDGRKVNIEITNNSPEQHSSPKTNEQPSARQNSRKNKQQQPPKEKKNRKNKQQNDTARSGDVMSPKGAQAWTKYFEGQVEAQPFYTEFAKKRRKKK